MSDVAENINFLKTTWLLIFKPSAAASILSQKGRFVRALQYYFISLAIATVISMAELMIITNNHIKKPESFVIIFFDILYSCVMFIPFAALIFIFMKTNLTDVAKLYLYFMGLWHLSIPVATFLPRIAFKIGFEESSTEVIELIRCLVMAIIFGNISCVVFNKPVVYFWIIFVIWRTIGAYFETYYHHLIDPLWDRLSG